MLVDLIKDLTSRINTSVHKASQGDFSYVLNDNELHGDFAEAIHNVKDGISAMEEAHEKQNIINFNSNVRAVGSIGDGLELIQSEMSNVIQELSEVQTTTKHTAQTSNDSMSAVENILEKLLKLIDKKRILIPVPLFFANLSARFFQMLPKPLLTQDQLILLKYDNILSNKYKSNSEIGIPSKKIFDQEVKKYCYMWKEGGEFNTSKYKSE